MDAVEDEGVYNRTIAFLFKPPLSCCREEGDDTTRVLMAHINV